MELSLPDIWLCSKALLLDMLVWIIEHAQYLHYIF